MKTKKIKIKTKKEEDRLTSDLILLDNKRSDRYAVGGVPKGQEGRQEDGGPMVPGPWHYIYGLASVIAADPERGTYGEMKRAKAENRVIEIADGTELEIDGLPYAIQRSWNGVMVLRAK